MTKNDLIKGQQLAASLLEVTTLEITTMIVETIPVTFADPKQIYQVIYELSPSWLQQQGIAKSLGDRYLQLREELVREYALVTGIRELPSPTELANSAIWEQNPRLVAKLRQLAVAKEILDQNQTIYAQTIIDLEGKIIHKYSQTLLPHPQQELILKLHSQGVNAATNQWQRILKLFISIFNPTKC